MLHFIGIKPGEAATMPAKNPRINVVLDDKLYNNVRILARADGVSLSTKVKDLIKEAMEVQEDLFLAKFAEDREKTWDKFKTLTHDEIWSSSEKESCIYSKLADRATSCHFFVPNVARYGAIFDNYLNCKDIHFPIHFSIHFHPFCRI